VVVVAGRLGLPITQTTKSKFCLSIFSALLIPPHSLVYVAITCVLRRRHRHNVRTTTSKSALLAQEVLVGTPENPLSWDAGHSSDDRLTLTREGVRLTTSCPLLHWNQSSPARIERQNQPGLAAAVTRHISPAAFRKCRHSNTQHIEASPQNRSLIEQQTTRNAPTKIGRHGVNLEGTLANQVNRTKPCRKPVLRRRKSLAHFRFISTPNERDRTKTCPLPSPSFGRDLPATSHGLMHVCSLEYMSIYSLFLM